MKKIFIFFATAFILLIVMSGCGEKKPNVYVSKRGEYALPYPSGWEMLDDERKMTELRKKVNEQMTGPMKFEFNPDVIFRGGKTLGGMVVINPIPLFGKNTFSSLNSEKGVFAYFQIIEKMFGLSPKESSVEEINGKKYRKSISSAMGGGITLSAMTFHENRVYNFQFSCIESEFDKWKPIFENSINNITFNKEDISASQITIDENKSGFFTGLWHGLLVPFRFIASFFMNIDIYADNNTGNGYLIGFILGVVFLLGGGGGSSRR